MLVVNSKQFVKRIQALGRKRGLAVSLDTKRGKGSHAKLTLGDRFCTLAKLSDIRPGALRAMCRQLGIAPNDL